jgi:hypothetical protein
MGLVCPASYSSRQENDHSLHSAGGLPDGWAGSERAFSRLEELDLSGNYLGFADAGTTPLPGQPQWCLPGEPPADAGWCAPQPPEGAFGSLLSLDLSFNGLEGAPAGSPCNERLHEGLPLHRWAPWPGAEEGTEQAERFGVGSCPGFVTELVAVQAHRI